MAELQITTYHDFSDERLRADIERLQLEVEHYHGRIEVNEGFIAAYKAELGRRALDAFWEAHPGLRLEVGDRLAITEEFQTSEMLRMNGRWYPDKAFVYQLDWRNGDVLITIADEPSGSALTVGNYRIGIVSRMRQAYLDSQEEREK